jgi:hypothetical protein
MIFSTYFVKFLAGKQQGLRDSMRIRKEVIKKQEVLWLIKLIMINSRTNLISVKNGPVVFKRILSKHFTVLH